MSSENFMTSMTRRDLVVKLGGAAVALGAGALLAGCGGSSSGSSLTGNPSGSPSGLGIGSAEIANAFRDIMQDEDNHVVFLVNALGSAARPAPTFTTARLTALSISAFVSDSAALENTGTGAYLAAVPLPALIASPSTLQAAASIALVEGRHAGFLNALLSRPLLTDPNSGDTAEPNDNSREVPIPPSQVLARAMPFTGTIGNGAGFDTNLNGGPPLPTDATIASASLTDILNYALFLEYLEKTFYDINVPHYFG